MADARLVPSGLMAWPRVRDLPPCHKLILYHLWASCESAAGCALAVPATLAAELGLPQAEVEAGLAELGRRGLIRSDGRTGEVLIADWGRVHKARAAVSRAIWESALGRIASPRLRRLAERSMRYAFERDAPGTGGTGAARVRRQPQAQVAPAPAAPPPPWAGCLEALRRRGVTGRQLGAAQRQLAALRTAEGAELSASDWGRVAEALARAGDPVPWLRAVASSGWLREPLAEVAHPGETAAQAKARLARPPGPRQEPSEQDQRRARLMAEARELEQKIQDEAFSLEGIEKAIATGCSPKVREGLEQQAARIREYKAIHESRLKEIRRDLGLSPLPASMASLVPVVPEADSLSLLH